MKPLQGIRVLEFARVLAGPMAGQILAELGAEVIKIEHPKFGDESRIFEPEWQDGESAYFTMFNRGKRSITLNLKTPEGQKVARELAATADVLTENFLPGRMEKLGLGPKQLREINPKLVYVSSTGFGQDGPDAQRPGYDTIFQALSGLTSLTGTPDGPPCKAGLPFADLTSGLWIVIAALTGLAGRNSSGEGTHVDLAMMDVQLSLLSIPAARFLALDEDPQRTGTAHHGRVPSQAFQCADGVWLQISASDQHWHGLCEALELHDLKADAALVDNSVRVERREEIVDAITRAMAAIPVAEAARRLTEASVPNGEVLTVREALGRPQALHRGNQVDVPRDGKSPVKGLRTPGRFDNWDNPEPLPTPGLGNATEDLLRNELGYDDAAISTLKERRAI